MVDQALPDPRYADQVALSRDRRHRAGDGRRHERPHLGWRLDLFGALCLPVFVGVVLLTPRAPLFVAAFFATSALEVLGTAVGDWHWAVVTPVVPIPTGNPPSVVAGLYCCLDALVLVSYRAIAAGGRRFWGSPGGRRSGSELGPSGAV